MADFTHVKVGDVVTRMLAGAPMQLRVTAVSDKHIHCGDWTFDRETGAEEDPELGWGVAFGRTGSFLVEVKDV